MDALDYLVFGDDIACDALVEFKDSPSPASDMESYFDNALESAYVEYDEGQFVLAAAAILDTLFTGADYQCNDETFTAWARSLNKDDFAFLLPKAVAAVETVISTKSELREMWEENEEMFDDWLADKKAIRSRLKATIKKGHPVSTRR